MSLDLTRELPKLVLTDIDGVWTDGGMTYDMHGNEFKRFNTSDSAGVLFLRYLEIPVGIFTGEDTPMVARRAEKLKIDFLEQGCKNKLAKAHELCDQLGISLQEVAYIGDDLNDMEMLSSVGFSASPSNAPDYVKSRAHLTLDVAGGDGAFRAFVEHMVRANGKLEFVLDRYLNRHDHAQ